jgi:hypothetical protein
MIRLKLRRCDDRPRGGVVKHAIYYCLVQITYHLLYAIMNPCIRDLQKPHYQSLR